MADSYDFNELTGGVSRQAMGDAIAGVAGSGLSKDEVSGALYSVQSEGRKSKPLTQPTKLIFLGASITNAIAAGPSTISDFFLSEGFTVEAINMGVGGDTIADVQTRWDAVADTYADDPTVWVFAHVGGNDVSNLRPYSDADPEDLKTMQRNYANLFNSIASNGNTLVPSLITFRNYEGLTDDEQGSEPFNEHVVLPVIERLKTGYPSLVTDYINMYGYTKQTYLTMGTDGVHYTPEGYHYLRKFVCDCVMSIARFNRSITEFGRYLAGESDRDAHESIVWVDAYSSSSGVSVGVYPTNRIGTDSGELEIPLLSTESNLPNSLSCNLLLTSDRGVNSGGLATGDSSASLTNDEIKDNYIFTSSSDFVDAFLISGFQAGQSCVLTIAAYKNDIAVDRVTEFTADGGISVYELDPSNNNQRRLVSMIATADTQGDVTVSFRRKAGSASGYLSGIKILPLPNNVIN